LNGKHSRPVDYLEKIKFSPMFHRRDLNDISLAALY